MDIIQCMTVPEGSFVRRLVTLNVCTPTGGLTRHQHKGRNWAPHQTHSVGRGKRDLHGGVTLQITQFYTTAHRSPAFSSPVITTRPANIGHLMIGGGGETQMTGLGSHRPSFASRHATATLTSVTTVPSVSIWSEAKCLLLGRPRIILPSVYSRGGGRRTFCTRKLIHRWSSARIHPWIHGWLITIGTTHAHPGCGRLRILRYPKLDETSTTCSSSLSFGSSVDAFLFFAVLALASSSSPSPHIHGFHPRLTELVLFQRQRHSYQLFASQLHSSIPVIFALVSFVMFVARSRQPEFQSNATSSLALLVRLWKGVQEVLWTINPSSCHLLLPSTLAWWTDAHRRSRVAADLQPTRERTASDRTENVEDAKEQAEREGAAS